MSQEAKSKVLERLKGLKDSEITDAVTTMAAEAIEKEDGLFDRVSGVVVTAIEDFIDGLPKRVKWALKLLGVMGWIDGQLQIIKKQATYRLATALRDFSQPE